MVLRELEASLQQFGDFLLKAQLVREKAAPHCVRWVRRFLSRSAASGLVRPWEELRLRIRTRHYSYKTECSYADWVRRFFAYVSERQQARHPRVDADSVRNYPTYLAVRQQVSASTQNQALCALLFLCREVLGFDLSDLSATARAKRGPRLPTVLSVPETAALLRAMRGTPWLMAALICGAACASPNAANCVSRTSTSIRDSSSCAAVRATRTARRDDGLHARGLRTPPRSPLDVLQTRGP